MSVNGRTDAQSLTGHLDMTRRMDNVGMNKAPTRIRDRCTTFFTQRWKHRILKNRVSTVPGEG